MKIADMRKKTAAELEKEANKLRVSLATATRERYTKDEQNVRKHRQTRKELAKVLTIAREKQLDDKAPAIEQDKEKKDD